MKHVDHADNLLKGKWASSKHHQRGVSGRRQLE